LQTVREEERGRIAREIHDELGQVLTGLKMDLSWLASRLLKNQKPLLKKTKSMSELVDATIQTVRKISSELRPGIPDDLGLSAAIEWQTQEFENRTGIKCRFISSREDFGLDKERSTAVFRLFQETLTNVARHAEATRVDIELEERAGHLILKVHDNGKGITRRQISHSKSLGLLGMRERALLFEGEVEIKGIRGKGTTVTVQIPTGKEEAEGSQRKGEGKRERGRTPKRRIAGKRG
jgi:signal transduction histidine kinase